MRRTLLCFLLNITMVWAPTLLCFGANNSNEARKVLEATEAHINKAGGLCISFKATTLLGKTPQGTSTGTMDIMGKKFTLKSTDMLTWFDGKTQWSLQTGDTEVAMTEPTGTELQAINPYAFLSIYKRGFKYKMKQGKLTNGKEGYKLFLTADNAKQEIREIYLEVDKQYNPVRISMRQGKNQWVRIVVTNFKAGQKFPDSHFTFPKDKSPNTEIIDLR